MEASRYNFVNLPGNQPVDVLPSPLLHFTSVLKDVLNYLVSFDSVGVEEQYTDNLETALAECFIHLFYICHF